MKPTIPKWPGTSRLSTAQGSASPFSRSSAPSLHRLVRMRSKSTVTTRENGRMSSCITLTRKSSVLNSADKKSDNPFAYRQQPITQFDLPTTNIPVTTDTLGRFRIPAPLSTFVKSVSVVRFRFSRIKIIFENKVLTQLGFTGHWKFGLVWFRINLVLGII